MREQGDARPKALGGDRKFGRIEAEATTIRSLLGRQRPKKISGAQRDWLIERCRGGDFTLRGLVAELAERGLKVDYRTVWAFVRARTLTITLLKRNNAQRLRQIQQQITAIEAAILARLKADPDLACRLDGKQAASLAGLAPLNRQSEIWKGRAFIRGGRALVRQALCMPAPVACCFNANLAQTYQKPRKAGKTAKVAITAVMRKLNVLANALLRDARKWSPAIA